jgi:hypothetical protein
MKREKFKCLLRWICVILESLTYEIQDKKYVFTVVNNVIEVKKLITEIHNFICDCQLGITVDEIFFIGRSSESEEDDKLNSNMYQKRLSLIYD